MIMEEHTGASDVNDFSRRACDRCRLRKIRCDRQTPCSNCTTVKQQCLFTGAGEQPKGQKQRVLISAQYEEKIDQIEQRLGNIETVLHEIAQSQRRLEASTVSQTHGNTISSPTILTTPHESREILPAPPTKTSGPILITDRNISHSAFEGDSSMNAHAAFASDFLEHAVDHGSLQDIEPRMRSAVSSLRQLLHMQNHRSIANEIRFAHAKPLGEGGLSELPMPPLDLIANILRELKQKLPVTFSLICAMTSIEFFAEQCRKICFPTEDFSHASFVIANAGLYFILQEKAVLAMYSSNNNAATNYQLYCDLCRDNLETALASFNLLVPALKENIIALVMGAAYAIEIAKPSVAWQFSSIACQLCVTLGYHRSTNLPGESEDTKRRRVVLFWIAYILDKALALRLGRPSILHDYDITLSRKLEPFVEFDSHRFLIQDWLAHAEVQGKIYEELYSPGALLRPVAERVRSAQECVSILQVEAEKLAQYIAHLKQRPSDAQEGNAEIMEMLLRSDEVAILSSLTLVYRNIPPPKTTALQSGSMTFCSDCIDIARQVMQRHFELAMMMADSPTLAAAYMNWTILFSPFIPFIVLFCYVIESSDIGDLRRLERFKDSLEIWRSMSDNADRLFRLCQVLHKVALLYVGAKQRSIHDQTSAGLMDFHMSNEFDMYLNQLGLLPFEDSGFNIGLGGARTPHPSTGSTTNTQAGQVGDWFLGYTSMAGLSESSPSSWIP